MAFRSLSLALLTPKSAVALAKRTASVDGEAGRWVLPLACLMSFEEYLHSEEDELLAYDSKALVLQHGLQA